MTIGIDVDGVLFPIEDYQLREGEKFFHNIVDENGYGIKETFGCSDRDEVLFWALKTFDFNRNVKSPRGMAELINKLRKDNKVYIVTSRALADKNNIAGKIMRNELEKALKRNNIDVDGIIYTSMTNMGESKKEAIKKYNIDIMIDDKVEVVDCLKDVTNVICYETRNNRLYNDFKVSKVRNVDELENEIYRIIYEYNNSRMNILKYDELAILSDDEKKKYFEDLRKLYRSETDIYGFQKGEDGCNKIVSRLRKLSNTLYKPHIIHEDKFPKENGVILACNHLHSFDPLTVLAKDMKTFHLLAKSDLKLDKKYSKLFTSIGSIFVDNDDAKSRNTAKEDLIKVVLNGGNIMIKITFLFRLIPRRYT